MNITKLRKTPENTIGLQPDHAGKVINLHFKFCTKETMKLLNIKLCFNPKTYKQKYANKQIEDF